MQLEKLPKVQQDIIRLAACGLTDKEIGPALHLSFGAIRSHWEIILDTLYIIGYNRPNRTLAVAHFLGKDMEAVQVYMRGFRQVCSVNGCTGKHKARGYCERHYNRFCRDRRKT